MLIRKGFTRTDVPIELREEIEGKLYVVTVGKGGHHFSRERRWLYKSRRYAEKKFEELERAYR